MRARYIIGSKSSIDSTDRGLAYGDGLFETMSVRGKIVQRLAFHLDRLKIGCERLELPLPDRAELKQEISRTAQGIVSGHLKLILTRGTGPRGYSPTPSPTPTVILMAEPTTELPQTELTVATLTETLGENVKLAGIKHLNRLEQVLGRLELARIDADEGLMFSTSGIAIGGTSRNLFAVVGDRIRTPALDRAGIKGVMRRAILELCIDMQIAVEEVDILPAELHQADELFMTNALVGVQSVTRLDQTHFGSTPVASKLRQRLAQSDKEATSDA